MHFTLSDFAEAMLQIQKLGELHRVLRRLPSQNSRNAADNNKEFRITLAMIQSMTKDEREYPEQIHQNRLRRIAQGSGTDPKDVDEFVRQFLQMRPFMEKMASNRSSVPFDRKTLPLKLK